MPVLGGMPCLGPQPRPAPPTPLTSSPSSASSLSGTGVPTSLPRSRLCSMSPSQQAARPQKMPTRDCKGAKPRFGGGICKVTGWVQLSPAGRGVQNGTGASTARTGHHPPWKERRQSAFVPNALDPGIGCFRPAARLPCSSPSALLFVQCRGLSITWPRGQCHPGLDRAETKLFSKHLTVRRKCTSPRFN